MADAAAIEAAFARPDVDRISAALSADGSDFARELQDMMSTKSPTSLAIALRQMQIGRKSVIRGRNARRISNRFAHLPRPRLLRRRARGDRRQGQSAAFGVPPPASGPILRRSTPISRRSAPTNSTYRGEARLRYEMRQSRDGVIRIIDQRAAADLRQRACSRALPNADGDAASGSCARWPASGSPRACSTGRC